MINIQQVHKCRKAINRVIHAFNGESFTMKELINKLNPTHVQNIPSLIEFFKNEKIIEPLNVCGISKIRFVYKSISYETIKKFSDFMQKGTEQKLVEEIKQNIVNKPATEIKKEFSIKEVLSASHSDTETFEAFNCKGINLARIHFGKQMFAKSHLVNELVKNKCYYSYIMFDILLKFECINRVGKFHVFKTSCNSYVFNPEPIHIDLVKKILDTIKKINESKLIVTNAEIEHKEIVVNTIKKIDDKNVDNENFIFDLVSGIGEEYELLSKLGVLKNKNLTAQENVKMISIFKDKREILRKLDII